MADNTQLNPGSGGDIIASDDIGGVKFQRIKLCIGDDGQTTGDVSIKNPMPIIDQNRSSDIFQHPIHGGRYNQIEIAYDDTDPDAITDITVTKNNGGDATLGTGQAVFSTSTNTNGGVKAVTNTTLSYRPHFELYAAFSAIFSTGITSSYQRIGLYDANDGFYIGYEGTAFGITIRKGGVNTTTQRASFNVDTLTGAAGSNFTRDGVPENFDPTKDNLFRIRFGWLGAAPIFFEIMSPDGDWVTFHVIKHPNTVAATSINNPDLPITLDIQKTAAGATNLTVSTACWAAGTTSDLSKVGSVVTDNTLVKAVRSVLTAKKPNGSYTNIEATAGGNLKLSLQEADPAAVINISDNGGSITVDGTVAATQSGAWSVRNQDTAGNGIESATGTPAGTERGFIVRNIPSGTQNVSVQNASIPVTDNGGSLTVDGTVGITGTVTVSGTVTANAGTGTQNVSVQNASIPVTDNGGSLTVDGTVAATQSGTWNVGTLTSITNTVTVSGTVTANAGTGTFATSDANAVSQSTATAAQKGYLSLAGVTATLPTYTSGNTNAMTMTSNGLLRVDGSNVTQPVSGTVTADTELPTAAALADGAANPTTPTIGAAALGFNGTTWDRIRSEGNNTDAEAVSTSGIVSVCSHNEVFNGTTWDRARSIDAMSGTGANNTVPGILAVGTGPGYAHRYNPTALAATLNSASTIDVEGGNTMTWAIISTTTTQGAFIFEGTSDGSNWLNVEVFDAAIDQWVSGQNINAQTSVGKVFHVACGGYRQIRMRVSSALNGTISHTVNVTNSQQLLAGIDTGPAPHNFGYALLHKDGEYTTTQTGAALWTPAAGKRFVITDMTISTGGTTSGIVTIWQGASADTTYTVGTDPAIFKGEFAPSATAKPGMVKSFNIPYYSTTVDHVLRVTTSAAMTIYVQVNGYEI